MKLKHRSLALAAALSAALLGLSGCGSSPPPPSNASASGYAAGNLEPQASSRTTASLKTATVDGRKIIVDANGTPVYVYTLDNAGESKSVCLGSCALLWPAVESGAESPQLQGITAKVGSMPAADGGKQVTLNGMPIYYYAKDSGAGSATGQGVAGVWYVVSPDGSPIYGGGGPSNTASPTSSPSS